MHFPLKGVFSSLRRGEEEQAIGLCKMQRNGLNTEEAQYTYWNTVLLTGLHCMYLVAGIFCC